MDLTNTSVLVVEDDFSYALFLESKLDEWGCTNFQITRSIKEAKDYLEENVPDVALVDINLKDGKGWSLFSENDAGVTLIYLTSFFDKDHFSQVAGTTPAAFVGKTQGELALYSALDLALRRQAGEPGRELFRTFKVRGQLLRVPLTEITIIQSDGNYCYFFHGDRKLVQKVSLSTVAEQLPPSHFSRIHQRYMVNLNYIQMVEPSKNTVRIVEKELPIGRKFKNEFLDTYKQQKSSSGN